MTAQSLKLPLVIALLVLTSCSSQPVAPPRADTMTATAAATVRPAKPVDLTVFAAASLIDAFDEIGQVFEATHPGAKVVFNLGGSQNLRTQLEQGAQADVFASANRKEMDAVAAAGLVAPGVARTFVTNRLVVVLPSGNPGAVQTLQDLARPDLKLVLADEAVPAGRYAREVLNRLNATYGASFRDDVLANVVSNEDNVKQVLAKVQLGEADAGMVYVSDARVASELLTIDIPAQANVVAEYPIAVLTGAPSPVLAAEFVDFVLSPEGQSILKKWGFTPVASPN